MVVSHHMPFLLTRPLRDVTKICEYLEKITKFLLTRPLRDVTEDLEGTYSEAQISTHTPLTGRDLFALHRRKK